jgi:hypothetical protein
VTVRFICFVYKDLFIFIVVFAPQGLGYILLVLLVALVRGGREGSLKGLGLRGCMGRERGGEGMGGGGMGRN